MRAAKGSMARANRSGDKGHPCLVPLYKLKSEDSLPNGSLLGMVKQLDPGNKFFSKPKFFSIWPTSMSTQYCWKTLWASKDSSALSPLLLAFDCILRKSLSRFLGHKPCLIRMYDRGYLPVQSHSQDHILSSLGDCYLVQGPNNS